MLHSHSGSWLQGRLIISSFVDFTLSSHNAPVLVSEEFRKARLDRDVSNKVYGLLPANILDESDDEDLRL
ncbi:hypothetical protein ACROYT_G018050 [Oculina patagonica]